MKKRSHKKKSYSFAEKIAYFKRRVNEKDFDNKPFGNGYLYGADVYFGYGDVADDQKQTVKDDFKTFNEKARHGDEFCKGVMCAARDAAKARKNKTF